jgi:hypothetical protein
VTVRNPEHAKAAAPPVSPGESAAFTCPVAATQPARFRYPSVVPCIDRPARDLAADLLEKLADGRITNDEFEDAYPSSEDEVVHEVAEWAWLYYSDLKEHRLEGRHALPAESRVDWFGVHCAYRWWPALLR